MPSWSTHKRVYRLLEADYWVFGEDMVESIDRTIDEKHGHDVGRRSLRELLRALFVEYGDILWRDEWLKTTKDERRKFMSQNADAALLYGPLWIPRAGYVPRSEVMLHVPDEALVLGLLHHFLDLCMEYVKDNDATSWSTVASYARARMAHQFMDPIVYEVKVATRERLDEVFERLLKVLDKYGDEVLNMLVEEKLKKRGS